MILALASPVRREILWLVRDRELRAGDIASEFALSAPTISQHLSVLLNAGLIDRRVEGTFRYYSTRSAALAGIESLIAPDAPRKTTATKIHDSATATIMRLVVSTVEVSGAPGEIYQHFSDVDEVATWFGHPIVALAGLDGILRCYRVDRRATGTKGAQSHFAYLWCLPVESRTRVELHQSVGDEGSATHLAAVARESLNLFAANIERGRARPLVSALS